MSSTPYLTGDKRIDELLERVRECMMRSKTGLNGNEWQEIINYLKENLMTEERIQKEYESGLSTGKECERNRIAKMVEGIACQLFLAEDYDRSHTNSELASRYRDLAKRIKANEHSV
jgi:hypothetical protein